jgi:membrane protein DedA with SNARE-associated domain
MFKLVTKAESKLKKGKSIYFWSAIHPNGASVVALASGILKVSFFRFFLFIGISQLIWACFWGALFYSLGLVFLKKVVYVFMFGFLVLVFFWIFNKIPFGNKILVNIKKRLQHLTRKWNFVNK